MLQSARRCSIVGSTLTYTMPMHLLEALASAFINTFGITRPSKAMRRRAAWFIFRMMLLTIAVVAAIGYALYATLHR